MLALLFQKAASFRGSMIIVLFLVFLPLKSSIERSAVKAAHAEWRAEQLQVNIRLEEDVREELGLYWQDFLEHELQARQKNQLTNSELRQELQQAQIQMENLEDEVKEMLAKPDSEMCFDDASRNLLDSLRYD